MSHHESSVNYPKIISERNLSIYDSLERKNQDLWIPTSELERLLNKELIGFSIGGMPLRTRSKVVKQKICEILGYPIPETFKKTQPRFFGQLFDTYIQKSNNLQIWNEDISLSRRYVIIQVSKDDVIQKVRVITGELLSVLDKTGTFTQKYQARLSPADLILELVTPSDTDRLRLLLKGESYPTSFTSNPSQNPSMNSILPIQVIFERLKNLVGRRFHNIGQDQERNRGEQLHRLVCDALGYNNFSDDGQFPDIRHQLLEIKLQTSQTIDLGLVRPNSTEFLDIPNVEGINIRHCDVRYALFYAALNGEFVTVTHFFLSTGESFFYRFPQFGGKVINKKLQIPLPKDFFD
jgi:hypothetical protein